MHDLEHRCHGEGFGTFIMSCIATGLLSVGGAGGKPVIGGAQVTAPARSRLPEIGSRLPAV